MARTAHEEITLPWQETVDGAVAELGAIFRVELVGGKWQCSAKEGRCRTMIAKELSSQNEAKRHAEAHAATMPNVRKVAKSRAADAKPGAKKVAKSRAADAKPGVKKAASRRTKRADAKPDKDQGASTAPRKFEPASVVVEPQGPSVKTREPAVSVDPQVEAPITTTTLGVTYQTMGDGCLCGKTQGVCWVANAGEVVFARPPPPAVHEQVRDAVSQHYARERAASEAAENATREAAKKAARAEAMARARASKAAAKKAAVRKIAKAAKPTKKVVTAKDSEAEAKPTKETANKPAKRRSEAKAKLTKETANKPAKRRSEAKAKPTKETANKPARGRKAGHARSSKPKPPRGTRGATKEDAPVTAKPKETTPTPTASKPAGPVMWSEVEGKPRGVSAHGTFLIEPEGQGFALYFADPSGRSRHLRSGPLLDLRRAAEEYAGRGEPAPLRDAPSREQDEALMQIFANGAAGGA